MGDIGLWDVGIREKLIHRNFKVWELGACSMSLQVLCFNWKCMLNLSYIEYHSNLKFNCMDRLL